MAALSLLVGVNANRRVKLLTGARQPHHDLARGVTEQAAGKRLAGHFQRLAEAVVLLHRVEVGENRQARLVGHCGSHALERRRYEAVGFEHLIGRHRDGKCVLRRDRGRHQQKRGRWQPEVW